MTDRGLKKSSQFRQVYREGGREAGRFVTVLYLPAQEGGVLPGFVASRKNVGKAYQRNRAKRQMREIFRKLRSRMTDTDVWIVFIARFRPDEAPFQELMEDVESSLVRAGLILNNG
ncbi:MAG TPA: ribonuclease P protein component [Candidatus Krumholzibacterium sp.]|nr:ribonuclease P protein component [Candidatus Krumholzibacterium sp.]